MVFNLLKYAKVVCKAYLVSVLSNSISLFLLNDPSLLLLDVFLSIIAVAPLQILFLATGNLMGGKHLLKDVNYVVLASLLYALFVYSDIVSRYTYETLYVNGFSADFIFWFGTLLINTISCFIITIIDIYDVPQKTAWAISICSRNFIIARNDIRASIRNLPYMEWKNLGQSKKWMLPKFPSVTNILDNFIALKSKKLTDASNIKGGLISSNFLKVLAILTLLCMMDNFRIKREDGMFCYPEGKIEIAVYESKHENLYVVNEFDSIFIHKSAASIPCEYDDFIIYTKMDTLDTVYVDDPPHGNSLKVDTCLKVNYESNISIKSHKLTILPFRYRREVYKDIPLDTTLTAKYAIKIYGGSTPRTMCVDKNNVFYKQLKWMKHECK